MTVEEMIPARIWKKWEDDAAKTPTIFLILQMLMCFLPWLLFYIAANGEVISNELIKRGKVRP